MTQTFFALFRYRSTPRKVLVSSIVRLSKESMKNERKYTLEQLRSAWDAGKYSSNENDEFDKESILTYLDDLETRVKKRMLSSLKMLGIVSESEIKVMKDYNSTVDFIWDLHDKCPESNTLVDFILATLWDLNELSSNIKIELGKKI